MMRRRSLSVLTCVLLLPVLARANPPARAARSASAAAATEVPGPVLVGMAQTMLAGVPEMFIDILDNRMALLMKDFAGMQGKLEVGGSPFDLAAKLKEDKVGLGVFQGIEFAWVQAKHPELKPLMLALSQHKNVHAQLLVRKDAGMNSMADLRGKDLACPKKTKVHCNVFLKTACGKMDAAPKAFFGNIVHPPTAEMALDQLLEGKCHAVIADQVEVDFYKRVKPGSFNQFQVLETSAAFPCAVIAYREGGLDEATVKRLRDGLLKASKSDRGQDIMAMWQITEFAPVHAEYQRVLEEAARTHPETLAAAK